MLICSAACVAQVPQPMGGLTKHNGGTNPTKIVFHATSVHYEDEPDFCGDGTCSATKTTVEGYTDCMQMDTRVMFVLNCEEALAFKPTPHITISCSHIHANNDYDARLFGDSISFWSAEKYTPPPYKATFRIVSEKEVRRGQ
jgi:hypothetical protein